MTACLEKMAFVIDGEGVDPAAYAVFVASNVSGLDPGNSQIGATYSNTLSSTTSSTALAVMIVVLVAFIILIAMVYYEGYISSISLVSSIAISFAIVALYYVLVRSYSLSLAYGLLSSFQQSAVASILYTLNASLRSTIYLAFCR